MEKHADRQSHSHSTDTTHKVNILWILEKALNNKRAAKVDHFWGLSCKPWSLKRLHLLLLPAYENISHSFTACHKWYRNMRFTGYYRVYQVRLKCKVHWSDRDVGESMSRGNTVAAASPTVGIQNEERWHHPLQWPHPNLCAGMTSSPWYVILMWRCLCGANIKIEIKKQVNKYIKSDNYSWLTSVFDEWHQQVLLW